MPSLTTMHKEVASRHWYSYHNVMQVNCYAYALNCEEMENAYPGHLTRPVMADIPSHLITVENMRAALIKDGLIPITKEQAMSGKYHAIALRLDEHEKAHFLRHEPGRDYPVWSHKITGQEPTSYDEDNQIIEDPQNMRCEEYPVFGGFYAIPDDGIPYVPYKTAMKSEATMAMTLGF